MERPCLLNFQIGSVFAGRHTPLTLQAINSHAEQRALIFHGNIHMSPLIAFRVSGSQTKHSVAFKPIGKNAERHQFGNI